VNPPTLSLFPFSFFFFGVHSVQLNIVIPFSFCSPSPSPSSSPSPSPSLSLPLSVSVSLIVDHKYIYISGLHIDLHIFVGEEDKLEEEGEAKVAEDNGTTEKDGSPPVGLLRWGPDVEDDEGAGDAKGQQ